MIWQKYMEKLVIRLTCVCPVSLTDWGLLDPRKMVGDNMVQYRSHHPSRIRITFSSV